ncbi:MAG TPA: hypothetical protein VGE46_07965 [Bdellovibrio sp.]
MVKLWLVVFLCLSAADVFAASTIEINGKKFAIENVTEIECIADQVVDPVRYSVFQNMHKSGCNVVNLAGGVDCAKMDERFFLRAFIAKELREKNYCNCSSALKACLQTCEAKLSSEECLALYGGSCGTLYPRK